MRQVTLQTRDGRTLHAYDTGEPGDDRVPVVWHHGTPNIGMPPEPLFADSDRLGIRWISYDRPGYGRSTPHPGRDIASAASDVAAVADARAIDRFATMGHSGGGPHALACAALLPDRVEGVVSMSGPAPFDAEGLDWFAGMSPGNIEEFTQARLGEAAYRPLVERLAREAVVSVEAGQLQIPPDYELPEADLAALRARLLEPGYRERTHMTYLGGVDGWIDDILAMTRSWGFDLARIDVPVSVWYGPEDVLSPRGHAEWLISHVPGAERRELPVGGHLLADKDLDRLYAWLIAADK
jgi:pimeloyl-ACP methyl ester carboxylesterase